MSVIECTVEKPWNKIKQPEARVRHHAAREVGEQEDGYPGGDIVTMVCPSCGTKWRMELPQ